MDIKKQIRVALGLEEEVETLNLAMQAKLVDGTIVVSEAEELEAGISIMILAEDGTTMPLPVGNYETEDGVSFTVEEEGIVAEVGEKEEDELGDHEEEEDEMGYKDKEEMSENVEFDKEGLINEIGAVIKELLAEVKSDLDRLDAELKEMKGENTDLKEMTEQLETEKAELQSQITELSKEPATTPVGVSKFSETQVPKGKPYNAMSSKERFFYNLNK
jgi:vacuolar-type H+-ATPase subunit I/STV1